jgi:hypothetical protein
MRDLMQTVSVVVNCMMVMWVWKVGGKSVEKVVGVGMAMNFVGVIVYLALCSVRNEILKLEKNGQEAGKGESLEMVDEKKGLIIERHDETGKFNFDEDSE